MVIGILVLVVGLGLALGGVGMQLFRYELNTAAFHKVVLRLLNNDNRERAEKLTRAVLRAPVAQLAGFALRARVPKHDPQAKAPGDYRKKMQERSFEQRVAELLASQTEVAMAPVNRVALLSLIGTGFAAAGSWLAFVHLSSGMQIGLPIALVLLVTIAVRRRFRMRVALRETAKVFAPWVLSDDDP